MGVGTLPANQNAGDIIFSADYNKILSAIRDSWVGRNISSGAAEAGKDLGTVAYPWGTVRCQSLVVDGSLIDFTTIATALNSIKSAQTRSTSDQPDFIRASGSGASATVEGASTSLIFNVNGTVVSMASDLSLSSLTLAPSSNNTCLVNDTDASDQESTRTWGEVMGEKDHITIDTVGSEISSLVGQYRAFKINDGTNDEYFLAYIESTTKLSKIKRGHYLDSSGNPVNRLKFADNDTITLLSTGWVFLEDDGTTLDVTYRYPIVAKTAPSSPSTGDYWYDIGNATWKRYSGASFDIINRVLLGMVILDDTDCVGSRSVDFFISHKQDNTVKPVLLSTTVAESESKNEVVAVNGNLIKKGLEGFSWDITADLANSVDMYDATEQASRVYYLYISQDGEEIISDIEPYYDNEKGKIFTHPHNTWRCVGYMYNNSSSDIDEVEKSAVRKTMLVYGGANGYATTDTKIVNMKTVEIEQGEDVGHENSLANGTIFTINRDGRYRICAAMQNGSPDTGFFGLSKNSTQLTTSIESVDREDILCRLVLPANGSYAYDSSLNLKRGDQIRMHLHGVGFPTFDDERLTFAVERLELAIDI